MQASLFKGEVESILIRDIVRDFGFGSRFSSPFGFEKIVRECAKVGIQNVWMHNGMGTSVSKNAVAFCRENGISVIPGGCPMMYVNNGDFGHRLMRWFQTLTGKLPKEV